MEWISVKDRLPPRWQRVLLWRESKYMECGFLYGGSGVFVLNHPHDQPILGGVTHWMPLPEPPED